MASSVKFKYGTTIEGKDLSSTENQDAFVAVNKGMDNVGNPKYGSIYKGDKILGTTEANNLVLTSDITIAGGPLADEVGSTFGETIPAGTSLQDILFQLFCKELWPTSTSFNDGSAKSTIAAPAFTLGNSGQTVEVGTKCTLSNITIPSAAVPAINSYPTVSGFTYGYSSEDDNEKDSNDGVTSVTATVKTAAALNSDNYQLSIDYTGFNNETDGSATAGAVHSNVSYTGKDLIATAGTNKVKATVTGPKATVAFNAISQYYACSNVKKTRSGAEPGDGVYHRSAAVSEKSYTSSAATNSKELTVTGAYKYFSGYTTITDVNSMTSAEVRALTGIGSGDKFLTSNTTTVIGNTSTATTAGKSVVIAIPATYKLSVKEGLSGEEMIGVSFNEKTVDVTTGELTTSYKVYMYPITSPSANISVKNVIITK